MKTVNGRTTEYEIDDIFLKRHSPRAMSGEAISKQEHMTLFEAARWAPSSRNLQPWKFIYAMRYTPEFETFLSFLVDGNRIWCVRAGTLIVTISKKTTKEDAPSPTHSFDSGSAWENFALQASRMNNIVVHGIGGIYRDLIKEKLNIPDDYNMEMMIAVGRPGKIEDLPEDLRLREKPNDRKPLEEIICE